MCKPSNSCRIQSGNVACCCTCIWFIISIGFMVVHIINFDEKGTMYGELAVYTCAVGIILWILRTNIKEDDRGIKNNTEVSPAVLL